MKCLGFLVFLFAAAVSGWGRPPHVLFIAVDDLKPLLGCYGDRVVQTPHLDRLAARAVRFERAYANLAMCAPSRNALLTGLRPDRVGIYDLPTFFRRATPEAVTLPQRFRQAGYHAAALGKVYHIYHGNTDDALSWSEPSWLPPVGEYLRPPGERTERPITEAEDVPDSAYGDGQIADEAIRRLRAAAGRPEQRFFLAVGFMKPHLPFAVPKRYWDLYQREAFPLPQRTRPPEGAPAFAGTDWHELRRYSDMPSTGPLDEAVQRELIHGYHAAVSYVDAQIGRVLEELDRTGLAEETVVVLWGDHGFHLGDHGFWCKHTNYEQAARIPLLLAGPGVTSGVIQEPVETVDLYPTLCALAGIAPPPDLDGASLVPLWQGGRGKGYAYHVYPRGKIIGRAVRTEQYRLVEWKVPGAAPASAQFELYDYAADPGETRNLAAERPAVVAGLRPLLDALPPARPQWE